MMLMNPDAGRGTTRLRDKLLWNRMENCRTFKIGSTFSILLRFNDGTRVVMQIVGWESASIITIAASSLCAVIRKVLLWRWWENYFWWFEISWWSKQQAAVPDGDGNKFQLAPNFSFHLSMKKLNNKFTSGGSFFISQQLWLFRRSIIIARSQLSNWHRFFAARSFSWSLAELFLFHFFLLLFVLMEKSFAM